MVGVDRQLPLLRQEPGLDGGNGVLGVGVDGGRVPVEGRVPGKRGEVRESLRVDPSSRVEKRDGAELVEHEEDDGSPDLDGDRLRVDLVDEHELADRRVEEKEEDEGERRRDEEGQEGANRRQAPVRGGQAGADKTRGDEQPRA